MKLWVGWWMIIVSGNSCSHTTHMFNEPWNCSNHALVVTLTKYFLQQRIFCSDNCCSYYGSASVPKWPQKQSQSTLFLKISWGSYPQTPIVYMKSQLHLDYFQNTHSKVKTNTSLWMYTLNWTVWYSFCSVWSNITCFRRENVSYK